VSRIVSWPLVYASVVVSLAWPRKHLDHPHIGIGLQQMRRELWAQRVQRRGPLDAGNCLPR